MIIALNKLLEKALHTVINCNVDADTQIIDSALGIICDNKVVTVVAEGT